MYIIGAICKSVHHEEFLITLDHMIYSSKEAAQARMDRTKLPDLRSNSKWEVLELKR